MEALKMALCGIALLAASVLYLFCIMVLPTWTCRVCPACGKWAWEFFAPCKRCGK